MMPIKSVDGMVLTFSHLVKQAFDSIAGNTVVPCRSLKKFLNYHKTLYFAIYNNFCQTVLKSDLK